MQITLYHRSFPVAGAPVAVSLAPFPVYQKHTFTADGTVHDAEYKELRIHVPDGAAVVAEKGRLSWGGESGVVLSWAGKAGPVKSTAKEVFELAHTRGSGFRLAK